MRCGACVGSPVVVAASWTESSGCDSAVCVLIEDISGAGMFLIEDRVVLPNLSAEVGSRIDPSSERGACLNEVLLEAVTLLLLRPANQFSSSHQYWRVWKGVEGDRETYVLQTFACSQVSVRRHVDWSKKSRVMWQEEMILSASASACSSARERIPLRGRDGGFRFHL